MCVDCNIGDNIFGYSSSWKFIIPIYSYRKISFNGAITPERLEPIILKQPDSPHNFRLLLILNGNETGLALIS